MRAHIIENGKVINTIVVDSLDAIPNLIDASLGGKIGDLWDGVAFTPKTEIRDVRAEINALEATQTPRRMREALTPAGAAWLADLDLRIAALRADL